jgi:SAM-dependent methyltransferase
MVDAFGKALMDYLNGNKSTYVIRRDDGLIEEHDPGKFFTEYEQWENCEKEILKYVQGRVLDIGGGAGRHALYLQNKGFEVHVIDISPLAVEVMKRRGVKNVYLMDLMKLEFPENYFDSILMMYNSFGLVSLLMILKCCACIFLLRDTSILSRL